jgi:hypothetical protein
MQEAAELDAATRDRVMQEFEQDKARMEQVCVRGAAQCTAATRVRVSLSPAPGPDTHLCAGVRTN